MQKLKDKSTPTHRGKALTEVDPDIHRLAKIAAAYEGTTIRDYISKLVREAAKKNKD